MEAQYATASGQESQRSRGNPGAGSQLRVNGVRNSRMRGNAQCARAVRLIQETVDEGGEVAGVDCAVRRGFEVALADGPPVGEGLSEDVADK